MENAVEPYKELNPSEPTRSIIAWDDEEIDSLEPAFSVSPDTTFSISRWVEARVRDGVVLYPDIMVYHIIQQSLGDRPVYFAATAPPVYQKWGLQPHLVRHGLAFKLVDDLLEETVDTVNLADQMPNTLSPTWVNSTRSRELLWNVFQIDYLLDWKEWREPSTESSIPAQYYLAYFLQGMSESQLADTVAAQRSFEMSDHFAVLSRIGLVTQ